MWRQGRELITRSSSLYRSLQTWQMSFRSSSSLFSSTGGAKSQKLIIFLISVTITFLNLYEILLFSSFCLHESRLLRLCNSHSIVEFAFSIRLEFCERVYNIINTINEVKMRLFLCIPKIGFWRARSQQEFVQKTSKSRREQPKDTIKNSFYK